MKRSLLLSALGAIALSGCATKESACLDVTEISEQAQQCESLKRQIDQAKGQPLARTELERRYQTDCIDIHYYRDDRQVAICDNKEEIEEVIKAREEKLEAKKNKPS